MMMKKRTTLRRSTGRFENIITDDLLTKRGFVRGWRRTVKHEYEHNMHNTHNTHNKHKRRRKEKLKWMLLTDGHPWLQKLPAVNKKHDIIHSMGRLHLLILMALHRFQHTSMVHLHPHQRRTVPRQ